LAGKSCSRRVNADVARRAAVFVRATLRFLRVTLRVVFFFVPVFRPAILYLRWFNRSIDCKQQANSPRARASLRAE
jgi:hypothetical protein